ncbi:MAG: acyltransferase [Bacteroidia bacterium]|nr:MAG: acyltransferase [Bacteroidia bacterium]
MLRICCRLFLKIFGWKIIGENPKDKKCIALFAPHTSIWDVVLGIVYNLACGMKPGILIKEETFFFPMNFILRAFGGIPVNRKNPSVLFRQIVRAFQNRENLILVISPEGTRAPNPQWKTGFYRMAQIAKVPVYLGFADFKTKTLGYMGEFPLTGDIEKDMRAIKEKYKDKEGLYKDKFKI